jgi:hypothetical protein
MSSKKLAIKQQLCDQFIQKWFSDLDNSAREFYKVVRKKILNLNSTLLDYQKQDRVYITKLRTSNLKLSIESGRWNNIAKELRLCSYCNKKIGDEYHILFTCSNDRIVQLRQKHIPNYYWNPPVIYKMEGLFRLWNNQLMTNISRFIKKYFTIIITIFYI